MQGWVATRCRRGPRPAALLAEHALPRLRDVSTARDFPGEGRHRVRRTGSDFGRTPRAPGACHPRDGGLLGARLGGHVDFLHRPLRLARPRTVFTSLPLAVDLKKHSSDFDQCTRFVRSGVLMANGWSMERAARFQAPRPRRRRTGAGAHSWTRPAARAHARMAARRAGSAGRPGSHWRHRTESRMPGQAFDSAANAASRLSVSHSRQSQPERHQVADGSAPRPARQRPFAKGKAPCFCRTRPVDDGPRRFRQRNKFKSNGLRRPPSGEPLCPATVKAALVAIARMRLQGQRTRRRPRAKAHSVRGVDRDGLVPARRRRLGKPPEACRSHEPRPGQRSRLKAGCADKKQNLNSEWMAR